MPRQDHAAVDVRADRREQVRLLPRVVRDHLELRAERREQRMGVGDAVEVALRRDRREADERREDLLDAAERVVRREEGDLAHFTTSPRGTEARHSAGPSSRIRIVSVISSPQSSNQSPGMKWKVMPGRSSVVSLSRNEIVRSPQSGG
jgi:hypothetical protein